ncbi:MAG: ACT domain-containing protein [Oscillospiraceae bacterium]|jgi:ACT domain-containing protein|nr:ACT domain-containing protein [Oscillospiraceae bacterium]
MKAILTVIGSDRVGIIAAVCAALAKDNINILDISQTVMKEYFTMIMLVDLSECKLAFGEVAETMDALGAREGLSVRIQREDIFHAMHRI